MTIALGCEAGLYAATMTGLYFTWYADSKPSSFHFFNDNAGWLQMDKGGHCLAAYTIGKIGYEVMRATGLDEQRSIWSRWFLDKESRFPAWLNFAFGYGADGMTGCFENPTEIDGVPITYFDRTRQFYFSLCRTTIP